MAAGSFRPEEVQALNGKFLGVLVRVSILAVALAVGSAALAPIVRGEDSFSQLAVILAAVNSRDTGIPAAKAPLGQTGARFTGKTDSTSVSQVEPMFVEADYRLPDDSDVGEGRPYGAMSQGGYGLFSTENALVPTTSAWHMGFQYRYDRYRYLDGDDNVIKGSQKLLPISVAYNRNKWSFGLTVPFQNWEATADAGGKPSVNLSGLHDTELRAARQIWMKSDGSQAVTAHLTGRIPGGNYDTPYRDFSGKTRTGVRVGPAWAARGGWIEAGSAYSRRIDESWMSHLNLAYAYDGQDSMSRLAYSGSLDYRIGQNLALTGQLNGTYWAASDGPDGGVLDLLLGAVIFNRRWQASFGVPVSLQHDWGFGHDIGFVGGVSTRWE